LTRTRVSRLYSIYYMETLIITALGLAVFGIGFMLGSFIESIRSNALMMRMENALQQQYIDQQIKTMTSLKAMTEDDTRDIPQYEDY
jgi:hypothetical protein